VAREDLPHPETQTQTRGDNVSDNHTERILVPGEELSGGLAAAISLPSQTARLERLAEELKAAADVERVSPEELRNICLR